MKAAKNIKKNFRMTNDLAEKIQTAANKQNRSEGYIIRKALKKYFNI